MDPRIQLQGLNINKDKACCFDLRILVDGQFIKYVTIDLIHLFEHLPLDNKNQRHVALDLENDCRLPVNVEKPQISDIDSRIQVLNWQMDRDKACCFDFQILVDDQFIKYVTIDFIYLLKHLQLDLDNRNQKHIALNLRNYCRLPVVNVENPQLPEVKNPWHGVKVDYLELELEESLSFYADKVKSSLFKASVIAKFAPCPNKMKAIVDETAAYEWIKEEDIGPKFLGHITEVNNENQEGRVIGFLLELIPDARHATLDDLPQCQETLKKLHKLGIKHGNIKGRIFSLKTKRRF